MENLKSLHKEAVNTAPLPLKILQFGGGNFLRAFVDWMVNQANDCGVMHHGVAIIQSVSQQDNEIKNAFEQQDYLYHVYLKGIKNKQIIKEISLIKCIQSITNPNFEYEKYRDLFLSEHLEIIISNTTEAGIIYEEGDDILAQPPQTFPAKITALLHQRFQKYKGCSNKGLSILCCELIENNGATLQQYVLKHALFHHLEANFITWINDSCRFYNTLVDRIVTGFPRANSNEIKQELGYNDNLIVMGEYFHLWAIAGDIRIKEKLPLDKAGLNVFFMEDISLFRNKKVKILNGAHTALVPIALLLGYETVSDALKDTDIELYIQRLVNEEVLPTIDEDAVILHRFASEILERFYNPFVKHYLKDISLNSLSKWEARNYPTVWDAFNLQLNTPLSLFSFSALLVLYSGQNSNFQPNDKEEFINFIQSTFDKLNIKPWITAIIKHPQMWRNDFSIIPHFIDTIAADVHLILKLGMRKALEEKICKTI